MRQLKVLVVSDSFPTVRIPHRGIFLIRQTELLAKLGLEFFFLVPRPLITWPFSLVNRWRNYADADLLFNATQLGAQVVRFPRLPGEWFRRYQGAAQLGPVVAAARRLHRHYSFDVVFGVEMTSGAFSSVHAAKALDIPAAVLAIGSDVMTHASGNRFLRDQLFFILSKADLPIGVSENICMKLRDTKMCKTDPICVYLGRNTPPPPDPRKRSEIREKHGFDEGDQIAVFSGRICVEKGIGDLVSILPNLLQNHENLRIVFLGDGPLVPTLKELGRKLPRKNAIVLPGWVEPDNVVDYLAAADFFIFPSHSEGMPQSVLEAMDCKLPVISTRVGGIPEAVQNGKTGLLVDTNNPHELGLAIEKMIEDEPFRIDAGVASYERAKNVFDPIINAKKMADALCDICR